MKANDITALVEIPLGEAQGLLMIEVDRLKQAGDTEIHPELEKVADHILAVMTELNEVQLKMVKKEIADLGFK